MENTDCPNLPYDPAEFPRETQRHYISATEEEIRSMLDAIGLSDPKDLFSPHPRSTIVPGWNRSSGRTGIQ